MTEFLKQRNWNLILVAYAYACCYFSRFSLNGSHPILREQLGWDYSSFGKIISVALLIYAIAVLFVGPLADKLGGKKTILVGLSGAFLANLLFGASYYFIGKNIPLTNVLFTGSTIIDVFSVIWGFNYFFQAFGAVSIVKINSTWYKLEERGKMSGIFGAGIQSGRVLVLLALPIILHYLPWAWAFFIPAIFLATAILFVLFKVVDKPEDMGVNYFADEYKHLSLKEILVKVLTNKLVLYTTLLAFCLGALRNGVEHWISRFFTSQYHLQAIHLNSFIPYNIYSIVMPISMIFASLIAGPSTTKYFDNRRYPIIAISLACILYLLPILSILTISPLLGSAYAVSVTIIAIMFFTQMANSLLMGTLCADLSGRSASASTAGVFDSSQYLGGSLAAFCLSTFLDMGKNSGVSEWHLWPISLLIFAAGGTFIATRLWNKKPTCKTE